MKNSSEKQTTINNKKVTGVKSFCKFLNIPETDMEMAAGTLLNCPECGQVYLEQLDENGDTIDTIILSAGTAMQIQINGRWRSAILYYEEHDGGWGWLLKGDVKLYGEEIDGLAVRIPIYLGIRRCDGRKYHLYNFFKIPDSACCIGNYSYSHYWLSDEEAFAMYIEIIMYMCLDCRDQWRYGELLKNLLKGAGCDKKLVEMAKKVFDERHTLSRNYGYEARRRLIIRWVNEIIDYIINRDREKESSADIP